MSKLKSFYQDEDPRQLKQIYVNYQMTIGATLAQRLNAVRLEAREIILGSNYEIQHWLLTMATSYPSTRRDLRKDDSCWTMKYQPNETCNKTLI